MKFVGRGRAETTSEVGQAGDVDVTAGFSRQKSVRSIGRNRLQSLRSQPYLRDDAANPETNNVHEISRERMGFLKRKQVTLCCDLVDAEIELIRLRRLRSIEDIVAGKNLEAGNFVFDTLCKEVL